MAHRQTVQAFERIYESHHWGGTSLSGPGSDPERTVEFRGFLQDFIRTRGIRSVVDFGCGDWSYARLVDWQGAQYTGVDVVASVVEANRRRFGSDHVSFPLRNSADTPLPPADLFITKEVLQHLPSADAHTVLALASRYRYGVFVNDISYQRCGGWKRAWQWVEIYDANTDIAPGGFRLLALREPPFNLRARQALVYRNRYRDMRWTKEVLAVEPDAA